MRDYETFTVGEYYDPSPADKLKPIHTISEAIEKASTKSDCFPKTVIAIWDNEDRVVYIFLDGNQYLPM